MSVAEENFSTTHPETIAPIPGQQQGEAHFPLSSTQPVIMSVHMRHFNT